MAKTLRVNIVGDTKAFQDSLQGADKATEGFAGRTGKRLGSVAKTIGKGLVVAAAAGVAALTALGVAAFGAATKTAAHADKLAKTSQRVGMAGEAYQELEYALGQTGLATADTDRVLGRLNQRMGRALDGNKKYSKAFDTLGVSLKDSSGEARNAEDVFMDTMRALNEIEEPALRSARASEVFGTQVARKLMPAIEQGADGLQEARDRARELGIVLSDDALAAGERFTDRMDDLKRAAQGAFHQFGAAFMPLFADKLIPMLIDKAIPAVSEFADWVGPRLEQFIDRAIPVIERLAEWLGPRLDALIRFGLDALDEIVGWWDAHGADLISRAQTVFGAISDAVETVVAVVQVVVGWFQRAFSSDGEASEAMGEFLAFAEDTWETLQSVFSAAADAVVAVVSWLTTTAQRIWTRHGDAILGFLSRTWDAIKVVIDATLRVIRGIFDVFAGVFSGDWDRAWEGVKAIFQGVWDAIVAILGQVLDALGLTLRLALDGLRAVWESVWGGISIFAAARWEDIKAAVGSAVEWVSERVESVVSGISSFWDRTWGAIRDSFTGVWESIAETVDRVLDRITGSVDSGVGVVGLLWDGLKAVLAAPINWVIQSVFNNGIRRAWNAIARLVGVGELDAMEPIKLRRGGEVPGYGNGDKVPALLEPGEIVIRKSVSQRFRDYLLGLNAGRTDGVGHVGGDPVQRFAEGGVVERAKSWARSQVGKPYIWGGTGPRGYDCSGFLSAIQNVLEGAANIYARRFTSASIGTGRDGWERGSDGVFTVGTRRGVGRGSGGHVAGTLDGLNVESAGRTGPRVGAGAWGSSHGYFNEVFSLGGAGWIRERAASMLERAFKPLKALIDGWAGGLPSRELIGGVPKKGMDEAVSWVRGGEFANGGFVRRRPGGVLGLIGEGRHDEIVSPVPMMERTIRKVIREERGPTRVEIDLGGVTVQDATDIDVMTRKLTHALEGASL